MVNEQIKILRNTLGLSQADFANKLGRSYNTVFRWEKGSVVPKTAINSICSIFNVSELWLTTGKGEMTDKDHYHNSQNVFGNSNIVAQGNNNTMNGRTAENPELDELISLLKAYPIPSLINDFKSKLLKMKIAFDEANNEER